MLVNPVASGLPEGLIQKDIIYLPSKYNVTRPVWPSQFTTTWCHSSSALHDVVNLVLECISIADSKRRILWTTFWALRSIGCLAITVPSQLSTAITTS